MSTHYWTYIITNHTNSVLYTGITNNLSRRVYEHIDYKISFSFSRKYKLYKLVWAQEFSDPKEAIVAEKKIKGWTREKKVKLIESINQDWNDLSKSF